MTDRLGDEGRAPGLPPDQEPPADHERRDEQWAETPRDMTPAVGTRGEPGEWTRAAEGADVALARPAWGDAVWSFLYKGDTDYAQREPADGEVAAAARAMRGSEEAPERIHGPFIHAPVWTWEVPLYFWFGGIASGAAFAAFAADLAGDHDTAVVARRVSLAAVGPAPLLLIADLGRPGRFLNMLRIFKPRSPMNMGAWCLSAFSATLAGAVGADLLRMPRASRALGTATAALGGYLGSYTGVLLATTAVPLWSRSRLALGPIFVSTAAATGAAACRLTLVATGVPAFHPTRRALARIETGAMLSELLLSSLNERRMGAAGEPLRSGRGGTLFKTAKWLVRTGLALQFVRARPRLIPRAEDAASLCYLAGGLAFRFAWVEAGKASAADDPVVARTARGRVTAEDELLRRRPPRRIESRMRRPLAGGLPSRIVRGYTEAVRRASLLTERVVLRHR